MSDLVILTFDTETGATEAKGTVERMVKEQILTLEDAAVCVRREDGQVKVKQSNDLVGAGALGGAFWGMLIGLLFWAPWLGLAIGAVTGAIAGKYSDIGIDDSLIKEVSEDIEPGNSALFLLVAEATPDKVLDEFKGMNVTVYQTSLSKEDEAKLKEAFGPHVE